MSVASIARVVENLVDCSQAGTRDDIELLCEHYKSRIWWARSATLGAMSLEVLTNARCHCCNDMDIRFVGGLALQARCVLLWK